MQLNLVSFFVLWAGFAGKHGERSSMIGMRSDSIHVLAIVSFVCTCSIDELLYHVVSAGITDACVKMRFADSVQAELRPQRSDELDGVSYCLNLKSYLLAGSDEAMNGSSYGVCSSLSVMRQAGVEQVGSFCRFTQQSSRVDKGPECGGMDPVYTGWIV